MTNNQPLVSVVIITFNSSATIIETLDSVEAQTYENVELIVSDDSSTDDTVEICREWISQHGERFVHCEIVKSAKNTGVTPNVNRGVAAAHGEWLKILGGDDLFLPNAIEDFVGAIIPERHIIVTQYRPFRVEKGEKIIGELHPTDKLAKFYAADNQLQRKMIFTNFIDATIGYFIRRSAIEDVGGYDEDYSMFEDAPMFNKLSLRGYRFFLLEKECFLYRMGESITRPSTQWVYNVKFKESSLRFHRLVTNKHIPWWNIVYHQSYWMAYLQFHLIVKLAHNRNNRLSHAIKTIIYYLTFESYVKMIKGY